MARRCLLPFCPVSDNTYTKSDVTALRHLPPQTGVTVIRTDSDFIYRKPAGVIAFYPITPADLWHYRPHLRHFCTPDSLPSQPTAYPRQYHRQAQPLPEPLIISKVFAPLTPPRHSLWHLFRPTSDLDYLSTSPLHDPQPFNTSTSSSTY